MPTFSKDNLHHVFRMIEEGAGAWSEVFCGSLGQVTSKGLVNSNGQVGNVPTGVQFSLMSGGGSQWGTEASVSADAGRKLLSGSQRRLLLRGQVGSLRIIASNPLPRLSDCTLLPLSDVPFV